MRTSLVSALAVVLLSLSLFVPASVSAAELVSDYPKRPIRLIVGYPPGSASDFAARVTGHALGGLIGQIVVVDNRAGANAVIGTEMAARAPADGYTLVMLAVAQVVHAAYGTKLPYDLLRDFVPVSQATQQPYLVVVPLSLPVRSIDELIAYAKASPGQVNYASNGVGGAGQLASEFFSAAAGIRMFHVPYKGPTPALADVIAGQVQVMFASITSSLTLTRAGKLRALAVTTRKRAGTLPEVPAIAETIPGFEVIGWYGVMAPGKTPAAIVDKVAAAIAQGVRNTETRARVASDGSEAVGSSPKEFDRLLRSELTRYAKVIKDAGLHSE